MKAILCDFARVILLPKDDLYTGTVEALQAVVKRTGSAFLSLNVLNEDLLRYFESLQNVKKIIFTAGTTHAHPEIFPRIERVFDAVYTTKHIGYSKTDPRAFKQVAASIGLPVTEIFFVDDLLENVQAARAAGVAATQFTTNAMLQAKIQDWL